MEGEAPPTLFSVTRDGALLCWRHFAASREDADKGEGAPDPDVGREDGDAATRYEGTSPLPPGTLVKWRD